MYRFLQQRPGVYTGRKRVLSLERAAELTRRLAAGEEKAALSREFAVNRATVYRYLGRAASEANNKSKSRPMKWKAKKASPF
jgi:DNA invertase Pin-like site-specific DNA recombinase